MKITKKVVKEISSFCCSKMEEASDAKAVVFPNLDGIVTTPFVRIYSPRDIRNPGGIGKSFEIHYCPFCGEKIVFEESK